MSFDNGNGRRAGQTEYLSGPQVLIEQIRERQLDRLGGQDLRGSGFEDEEPDPEYGEEG
jgi:hypothetical protein